MKAVTFITKKTAVLKDALWIKCVHNNVYTIFILLEYTASTNMSIKGISKFLLAIIEVFDTSEKFMCYHHNTTISFLHFLHFPFEY